MFRFRLNDPHKLQTNKKGIIGAAMVSHGGIRGPLSYGQIPAFGWASAVRIAQILRISLPAHLAELLIDDVACFCLGFLTLAGRLAGPFTAAVFGNCFRLGSFCLRLLGQTSFGFLFRRLVYGLCLLLRSRHHEFMVLIVPVTIGLHEPLTKTICHLQKRLCV